MSGFTSTSATSSHVQSKVLYDSLDEYNQLCRQFKEELPQLLRDNKIDNWAYTEVGSHETKFGVCIFNRFETVLSDALSKLTKSEIPEWTKTTAEIMSDAVRGLARSITHLNAARIYMECPETCWMHHVELQDGFKDREVCNTMIVGIINNMLFDTESHVMGTDTDGMLRKVRLFVCPVCENMVDEIIDFTIPAANAHHFPNPRACGDCC